MVSSSQEECDRLRKAVQEGNINDIKNILSSGVNVNAVVDPYGVSKLNNYYMVY